jgi:hypothetical protein
LLYVSAKSNREELEKLYLLYSDKECTPTELGRKQFYDFETYGRKPSDPDPFYDCLMQGKKWFSVDQESIRKSYLTWEWYGWYQYWSDWKGERWVLKYLFSWHPHPPQWLFKDEEPNYEN